MDPDLEQRLVAHALLLAASPDAAASAALVPDSQALQVCSCTPGTMSATCSPLPQLGAAAAAAAAAAVSVCNMKLAADALPFRALWWSPMLRLPNLRDVCMLSVFLRCCSIACVCLCVKWRDGDALRRGCVLVCGAGVETVTAETGVWASRTRWN